MTSHFLTDVSCHPATRGHDLFNLAFEGVLEAWCFLMGFFILDDIFVINAFHQKETTGGNTRSPQHRVFPSVTAHGFTKVAALCCGPSLHSLKADPSKKTLAEIFFHMARNTLLTVLCFASAFGDLQEGIVESDIDDSSGSSEVIEPSFGTVFVVFGDRLTDAQ